MSDHIITFNAGSSSIKFALFSIGDDGLLQRTTSGQVDGLGGDARLKAKAADGRVLHDAALPADKLRNDGDALAAILELVQAEFPQLRFAAIGHRVVHGGSRFSTATLIDDAVLATLHALIPLAPLHLPSNIAGIETTRRAFPRVPQVACFDTAFHRGGGFLADAYALPRDYFDAGIRRYGFHGLSYEYIAGRLAELAPREAAGRVIVAHLGNGASMCALRGGRSIDTTMGFSALDGLPMGTRCGAIDPGVLLHLIETHGYDAARLSDLLYKESGLKGLSGISHDMRELEDSADPHAGEAIAYFCARIRREAGALAASLGGIDALVFTGGIGENSARVRAEVLAGLGWLGIAFDRDAQPEGRQDRMVSALGSPVSAWVIATDEEAMIARHALRVIRVGAQGAITSSIAARHTDASLP
ncbi:acetate/propionate family kinase [Variovorax sp. RA8]|uniref:acetate/propionate family kinase n=1 Tax=Variovorax sp. (strain JCM 16519 / RA8) TaxID=662548 RepID=UPI0013187067|nr:acetate/propionate family kinase [Variovorax sp. RA8]VTU24232.1 Acetate kinase [Variovorax sp. RA8]